MTMTQTKMDSIVVDHCYELCTAHNEQCDKKRFLSPSEWLRSITKIEGAFRAFAEFDYYAEIEFEDKDASNDFNTKISNLTVKRKCYNSFHTKQIYPPIVKEERK